MKVEAPTDFLLDKFSVSKLGTFSLCPRKAYYRYVARRDAEPPGYPIVAGNAMHEAMEADAYGKLDNRPLSIRDLHDAAVKAFEVQAVRARDQGAALAPSLTDTFASDSAKMLGKFEETGIRAGLVPVEGMVEAPFRIGVAVDGRPATIEGFIDLGSQIEDAEGVRVIDYKVVGRPVSQKEAATHSQLLLEIYAAGAVDGAIVNFVKTGQQKATAKQTPPVSLGANQAQALVEALGRQIFEFRRAYKAECWPQRTFDYMCRSCEFFRVCPGRGAPEKPKFVQITGLDKAGTLPQEEWRQSRTAKDRSKA